VPILTGHLATLHPVFWRTGIEIIQFADNEMVNFANYQQRPAEYGLNIK
jgi:hypothetical protein